MRILGIDWGERKVGLALADGPLAEPYKVIRYKDIGMLGETIKKIVEREKIEKVVVGVSEGTSAEESMNFTSVLSFKLAVPVETFDETLTTQEAQKLAIEAGIKRSKRQGLEDAYAATLMLQNYLDSNP